jgi:hypothetical protein
MDFHMLSVYIRKNLVICKHSSCNYMQLNATTYHLQLCFIMFITNHCLLNFTTIFCDYGATIKLCIIPYGVAYRIFHPRIGSFVHLVAKLIVI